MKNLLKTVNTFLYNDFLFLPQYRIWRHIIYWVVHTLVWAAFWEVIDSPGSYGMQIMNMALWLPVFIIYGYPMAYWAVPHFLLKGKIVQFMTLILIWAIAGLYIDVWFKDYIIIPIQEIMHPEYVLPKGQQAWCYLCITTAAAVPMVIKFFKFWDIKRQDWLKAQQEKITAELQLLKAQVHPHFLFNTLNNIYSFSLENSPKTSGLILKLSSLLSYMLYDCKTEEVRLEKELEILRNYIELESERYGDCIDISWNVSGNIKEQYIAPLMLIPFIENAFKHGTSEQIEKSWLSVDISVKKNILKAKIANSKNEGSVYRKNGIGIANVRKRLAFIYPDNHELKLNDDGQFFVVSLMIRLAAKENEQHFVNPKISQPITNENTMPSYR